MMNLPVSLIMLNVTSVHTVTVSCVFHALLMYRRFKINGQVFAYFIPAIEGGTLKFNLRLVCHLKKLTVLSWPLFHAVLLSNNGDRTDNVVKL